VCSKYYEKEALMADPVDSLIFASLLGMFEYTFDNNDNAIRLCSLRLIGDYNNICGDYYSKSTTIRTTVCG